MTRDRETPTHRVLIIHRVADVAAWQVVFHDAAGLRWDAGEREYEVLRSADDPHLVIHLSTWTSLAAARQFFESPELVAIRAGAGVEAPQFFYLDTLGLGSLSAS